MTISKPSTSSSTPPARVNEKATQNQRKRPRTGFDIWNEERESYYEQKYGSGVDREALARVKDVDWKSLSLEEKAGYERKAKEEWGNAQKTRNPLRRIEDPASISLFDPAPSRSPSPPRALGAPERRRKPERLPQRAFQNPWSPQKNPKSSESENQAWIIWFHEKLPFYRAIHVGESKRAIEDKMRHTWSTMTDREKAPYFLYKKHGQNQNLEPEDLLNTRPMVSNWKNLDFKNEKLSMSPSPVQNPKPPDFRILATRNQNQNPNPTERQQNFQQKMADALKNAFAKTAAPQPSKIKRNPKKLDNEIPLSAVKPEDLQNRRFYDSVPNRFSFINVRHVKSISQETRDRMRPMVLPDGMKTNLAALRRAPETEQIILDNGESESHEEETETDDYERQNENQESPEYETRDVENFQNYLSETELENEIEPELEDEDDDSLLYRNQPPEPIIMEGVSIIQRLMDAPKHPPPIIRPHDLTPITFVNPPELLEPFSEILDLDGFEVEIGTIGPTIDLPRGYPLEDVLKDLCFKFFTNLGLNF